MSLLSTVRVGGQILPVRARGCYIAREPLRHTMCVYYEYCKAYKLNDVVALGLRFCLHGMRSGLAVSTTCSLATRLQQNEQKVLRFKAALYWA
jgi:hypothetical protein